MLLLSISLANASAYYFLDSGVRALGRGGANVVGASDLSALYYNPAALIHLDRSQVHVETWAVQQAVTFDRADEAGPDGQMGTEDDLLFDPIENEAPWMIEPNFGLALRFREGSLLEHTVIGFGFTTPTAPNMQYPVDGAQRYVLTRSLVWQGHLGPSVAQQITPWLTLGAGFNYSFLRVDEDLAITTAQTESAQDDRSNDIDLSVKAWDKLQFGWTAGILLKPVEQLEIGASVSPASTYRAEGTLGAQFHPDHSLLSLLEDDAFVDDDITAIVTTPWQVRAGVLVRPTERFDVEASFVWQDWSTLQELVVTDLDLVVDVNAQAEQFGQSDAVVTDDVIIPTGFQDSWSVRLGGDYRVHDWVTLRAGGHYETSAVPDALQAVSVVDGRKFGYGAGATIHVLDRAALDLAFSQQFLASRTITDSEVHQITVDALSGEVGQGKIVGNGDFSSALTFAGLGATVYFGGNDAAATP